MYWGNQVLRKQGPQLAHTPKKGRIDAHTRETPRYPSRARRGELYVCQADHDTRWTPGLCRGLFGSLLTWEDCFEQADLFCKGRSYEVYTRPDEESPLIASEPQDLRANPTTNRRMVIVCKGS